MTRSEKAQTAALERIAAAVESTPARPTDRQRPDERLPILLRTVAFLTATNGRHEAARAVRRAHTIRAYVGPNGGGKSLAMIDDVIPSLMRGRRVLSTVPILDAETGQPHPLYTKFEHFDQLIEAEHCDVLMDEIVGIANSRDAMKLPTPVQNVLMQMRRRDLTLSVTAPAWARMDKIIREVTQLVTECRGYFPKPAPPNDAEVSLWRPRRLFRWRSFDTLEFDEWTSGRREKLKPLAKQWFKGPGSEAFRTYNTLDAVSMVSGGNPDECEVCGRHKRREMCGGHDGAAPVRRHRDAVAAGELPHAAAGAGTVERLLAGGNGGGRAFEAVPLPADIV